MLMHEGYFTIPIPDEITLFHKKNVIQEGYNLDADF
jgi:hypothetical protein